MEPIKTYQQVDRRDGNSSFGISRMEAIYEKRHGKTDSPHRHDFYTILLLKQGKGLHYIDFSSYPLGTNQVYFISPGQVHQLVESEKSFGYSMVFSEQFLAFGNISPNFILDINLFHDFGNSPPLEVDAQTAEKLYSYCEDMLSQNKSNVPFASDAIGALLKLFLIRCHHQCSLHRLDDLTRESGGSLLRNFKTLVNGHYKEWHHVASYAEELHVTPDHLNRVVKSLTGKTTKEHLQSRITIGAKRLLYFTDLTNKEIAYQLGFSEPANFSTFFKKCMGMSPSEFKHKNHSSSPRRSH